MFSCSIEGPRNFLMMCPEKGQFMCPEKSPHGTCFHVARVVSTPSNWKVSLMLCGNQMCPPERVSTYSNVQEDCFRFATKKVCEWQIMISKKKL